MGSEHARHFRRKVDAQQWLNEVAASVVTGTYVDPGAGRTTFRQFFDDWSSRQIWVPGTVSAMRLAAGSVPFGDLPLSSLRRSHVEHWVKSMDARGLAPGTVTTRFNNVRAVLRAAKQDRVIGTDPTEGVQLPRRRRREAAMELPTPETVGRLLDAAAPDFRAFVGLCAFAGLRLGEASAVQVGDVNFLRRTLQVVRQAQRANGGTVEVRAPKYGSERVVYLPDRLVAMLSAHIQTVGVRDRQAWLFESRDGQPAHQNSVGHRWRRTLVAAGLSSGDHKLHDLRHFYASGLIAAGCDVVTVQRALGHSSANTTLSTYSHLWPTAEDRTRKAAEHMMATALADTCGLPADSDGMATL
jgi:integrase